MTRLAFTVPGRPVGFNEAWERTAHGMRLSDAAKEFKTRIQVAVVRALGPRRLPVREPCEVTVVAYRKRDSDADAAVKLVMDAMKGLVYGDDAIVAGAHTWKAIDTENPRTEVLVIAPAGARPTIVPEVDVDVAILERPRPARAPQVAGSRRAETAFRMLTSKTTRERELAVRRRLRPAIRRPS